MNTIVYLIRHSEKLDMKYIDRYYDDENYQITREKRILSAEGERKANILSKQKEFDKVDVIYSSSYVRTIQTAKYLAERLDKKIHVNRNLNERKYGNPKYAEDITLKQYYDEKIKNVCGNVTGGNGCVCSCRLWNEKFKWRGYGSNNWMECGRS